MASATKLTTAAAGWTPIAEARGRMGLIEIDAYGAIELAVSEGRAPDGSVAGHAVTGPFRRVLRGRERVYVRGAGVQVVSTILAADDELAFSRSNTAPEALLKANAAIAAAGAAQSTANAAGSAATAAQGTASAAAAAAAAADGKAVEAKAKADLAYGLLARFPEQFGAVGDGVTDDTAAIKLWKDYLVANGLTGVIDRFYVVSTVDMYPSASYGIMGTGDRQCGFIVRNPNRNQVGLKFTHPTTPSTRGKQYQLADFGVVAETGTKACLIEHRYCSAAKWNRIRVSGYHGATGVRLEKCWNVDINELSVWGCGHNVVPKNIPVGVTFSIASGAAPIIASADVFSAADVGRFITLAASASTTPQTFKITGFTDARTVSVDQPRAREYTNVPGTFGGIRGSMTSGSNVLTLEANVLTGDDIGRKVYVVGAYKHGYENNRRPLPARILGVNGSSITLDAAAVVDVANAELIFDPAVDFGDNDYAVIQKTNDFNCSNLHVEHHRGCGLVVTGVTLGMPQMKLHAVGHTAKNNEATNIQMLAYDASGHISGTFEQVVASNVGRILVTGSDAPLSIGDIETVLTHGSPTVRVQNCEPGAAVVMNVIKGLGTDQTQNAMDGCLSTDGTGLILAKIIGAPGQSYRRLNVTL